VCSSDLTNIFTSPGILSNQAAVRAGIKIHWLRNLLS